MIYIIHASRQDSCLICFKVNFVENRTHLSNQITNSTYKVIMTRVLKND